MSRSIKHDFQYLSVTTTAVAMILLSGFWIYYDYKMLNLESERLRTKHMVEYEHLLHTEVHRVITHINYEKSVTEQRLRQSLKERTNEAYSIATNLFKQNRGTLNDVTLRKLLKDSLRDIRFHNGRGYFFAFNKLGTIELLPTQPSLEGQNLSTGQHNQGQFIVQDALEAVRSAGEGFYSFPWSKPNKPGNSHPKLAYLRYIPELEWIIGAGEDLNDFTLNLQQKICEQVEQFRFGKENKEYIFIANWDGIGKTYPATGKNMLEVKDANGVYIVQELIKKAKEGGGFVQYVMPPLNRILSAPKLSYAAPIPEWQWYVGAGVYIDEIDTIIAQHQQLFRDKVLKHLLIMVLVLVALLMINYVTAYVISRNIWIQLDLFSKFFRRASTESISIDSGHLAYSEFREIGDLANVMLEQRNEFLEKISLSRDEWINTFNAIGDCVILFDSDGKVVRANEEALNLHGMTPDEIENQHCTDICSDNNPVKRTLVDQLPHGAEVNNRKLNTVFWASSFPIFTGDGEFYRMILIARDITEQRRLEEKLAQSKKMEAIGLLAGGVAHDLNNILSGVVSYPDIILAQMPEENLLKKQILAIQKSGQQAAEIVADLLTLARGIIANKKVIDLNVLIQEHLESPECDIIRKINPLLSLTTALDQTLLPCFCSPVHIKKSLMNLIINASESISGDGQINISTSNLHLELEKAKELHIETGKYLMLKIEDTGTGIPPAYIERIFEPFYTKKVLGNSGSGLGLSIVWNSITDHDGAIEVTSSKTGSKFTIFLPATEESIAVDDNLPSLNDLKAKGESVLIVDDDEQQRDIALQFINTLGYTGKAVASGEEALIYLADKQTDVIILDMILGSGMNGRKTYEKMIQLFPGQKALIVSGYSLDSEVKIAQQLGAGPYVKKPYTLKQMGFALKKVLATPDTIHKEEAAF
jgi:PAS domain S-box-containing protein